MAQDVLAVLYSASSDSAKSALQANRWERVMLLVRLGGGEVVRTVLGVQTEELRKRTFCVEANKLNPLVTAIAKFLTSGGFTVICDYLRASAKSGEASLLAAFLSDVTQQAFEEM